MLRRTPARLTRYSENKFPKIHCEFSTFVRDARKWRWVPCAPPLAKLIIHATVVALMAEVRENMAEKPFESSPATTVAPNGSLRATVRYEYELVAPTGSEWANNGSLRATVRYRTNWSLRNPNGRIMLDRSEQGSELEWVAHPNWVAPNGSRRTGSLQTATNWSLRLDRSELLVLTYCTVLYELVEYQGGVLGTLTPVRHILIENTRAKYVQIRT